MFEHHFGLRENPFVAGHHARFVYPSPEHQEALAHLRFGIENREPFVLITGEVGTGKTTALYDALGEWHNRVTVALINNPAMTRTELLEEIALRFGLNVSGTRSKPQILIQLENALTALMARGERAILLLDEAQNLERDLLEEIRLLSNLELDGNKLVQVFLIGQPELEENLARPELRQLRQRITVHYRLRPLSAADTERYIHHRIGVAGGHALTVFPTAACLEVHRLTHGIPREINTVASQAMLNAFVEDEHVVEPRHVTGAAAELEFESVLGPEDRPIALGPPRVSKLTGSVAPIAKEQPPPAPVLRAEPPPAPVLRAEPPPAPVLRAEPPAPPRFEPPQAPVAISPPAQPPQRVPSDPAAVPAPDPAPAKAADGPKPAGATEAATHVKPEAPAMSSNPPTPDQPTNPPRPKDPAPTGGTGGASNLHEAKAEIDSRIDDWMSKVKETRARTGDAPAAKPAAPTPTTPRPAPPSAGTGAAKEAAAMSPRLRAKLAAAETGKKSDDEDSGAAGKWIGIGMLLLILVLGGLIAMNFMGKKQEAAKAAAAAAEAAKVAAADSTALADSLAKVAAAAAAAAPATPAAGTAAKTETPAPTTPSSTTTAKAGTSTAAKVTAGVAKAASATGAAATKVAAGAAAVAKGAVGAAEKAVTGEKAAKSTFGIAVGQYLDADRAESQRAKFAESTKLAAAVQEVSDGGTTAYQVVLGSFGNRAAAEKAAGDLIGKGLADEARVVAKKAAAPAAKP